MTTTTLFMIPITHEEIIMPTQQFDDENPYEIRETPADKVTKFERPGPLSKDVQLVLHTVDAQTAFMGHGEKGGMGLFPFASRMGELWEAAAKDDPYADWYLLKIYDTIIQLRNSMATIIQDYQQQLTKTHGLNGFIVYPFQSEKPLNKSLYFNNPYGYLGAQIIADFDTLMRIVLTAKRIGVLLTKSHHAIRDEWLQPILVLFKLPFKWQNFQISRTDVELNSANSIIASDALGKLPAAILAKKLRAPFAPTIQMKPIENNITDVSESLP